MARFMNPEDHLRELALDDVFLVQQESDIGSRRTVKAAPLGIPGLRVPIVSANMASVTGARLAGELARKGGLGVLHQDYALEAQVEVIHRIKSESTEFEPALVVGPDHKLHEVIRIIDLRAARLVVVVDSNHNPIGVVTSSDYNGDEDEHVQVGAIMRTNVQLLQASWSVEKRYAFMDENRIVVAPVVNETGVLIGVESLHDNALRAITGPSLDGQGRLMVAATVGINGDSVDRAVAAVEAGADVIVVDTAHGFQTKMRKSLRAVVEAIPSSIPVVAGNVCTGDGVRFLVDAGASIVKVNVGPGAMCTTRIETGVGRPTFSAVLDCAETARELGAHVMADGAVRRGRDVALYTGAGADTCMVGTAFAGTYESPNKVLYDGDGNPYKRSWGMASGRAVQDRNKGVSPREQMIRGMYREGISDSRVYLQPGRDTVGGLVEDLVTGLQSAMTYTGAGDLSSFHKRALFGVQTASGFREGTPHGKVRK